MKMTPEQKLKWAILLWDEELALQGITSENVDAIYEEYRENGKLDDAVNEIRWSGEETGLPCTWSRLSDHYESKSVAAKMPDGSYVGWTFWFGGGKHGCPEEIEWMSEAYDLDCVEEEKLVTVRTFTKVESK